MRVERSAAMSGNELSNRILGMNRYLILVIAGIVGGSLVATIAIVAFRKPNAYAYRMNDVISATKMIASSNSLGRLELSGNQEFALIEDAEGNRLFYKIIDTWNAVGEIGVYISSTDGMKLFYGVDLPSSKIYINSERGEIYYVDENIFPNSLTHKKLLEFFKQNAWEPYHVSQKGQVNLYK